MGQLTALAPNTTIVKTKSGDLSVRGLAFEDFWAIAQAHGPQASMLFNKVLASVSTGDKLDVAEVYAVIKGLLPQTPSMVAQVIALACDEDTPEGRKAASQLPPTAQLEVLEATFVRTIESEAELKKFMESILRMLAGSTSLIQQMRLPLSEAGFGESVRQ